jgi:hypothetical protein
MHLSPAATEDAIRLLDSRIGPENAKRTGDILDRRSSDEKWVRSAFATPRLRRDSLRQYF